MSADKARFDQLLDSVLRDLVLELDSKQMDALYRHYALLSHWNKGMNLTAIRDVKEIVFRHFGESLAVAKLIGPGTGSVVDVGSGAGFPGAPIAVCWRARHVTLVESAGKKAIFLKEIARLQENITVEQRRFEEFEGSAEWVVIRGVARKGVEVNIRRVAQKVALIGSAAKGKSAALAGTTELAVHKIPWDKRTLVLIGEVPEGAVPRGTKH
jgi:16S rRNA (guanine(527)-N(7))-methyltransferase RsmG